MNRPLAAAALAAVTLAAFLLVMGMLAHAAGWSDDLQMQKWFAGASAPSSSSSSPWEPARLARS
jgi:hypothetical protein